jgi:hypothetical protein
MDGMEKAILVLGWVLLSHSGECTTVGSEHKARKANRALRTTHWAQQDDAGTRPPRLKAKPMAGRRGETVRRRLEVRIQNPELRFQLFDFFLTPDT